jgi:hypothetical protein
MLDDLRFAVEMWTMDGHVDRVLARSSSIVIARAAFQSALSEYPGARLTLSQGGRLLDSSNWRE